MSSHTSRLAIAIAAIGLLASSLAARAETAVTTSSMVQTSDLDLRTETGAAVLRHRVRLAARHVCGENGAFSTPEYVSYNACVDQAEQQALKTSDALIASVRTGTRYAAATPAN